MARNFFGVSEIEGNLDSSESGGLKIHIGDALAEGFLENRKFSGVIVDLYSDGVVIPDLQDSQVCPLFIFCFFSFFIQRKLFSLFLMI